LKFISKSKVLSRNIIIFHLLFVPTKADFFFDNTDNSMRPTSLILFSLPTLALAFSSIPANFPQPSPTATTESKWTSTHEQNDQKLSSPRTMSMSEPWRIVLDIGREPLSRMPFDWARSGCRMPLAIPCDFSSNYDISDERLVLPQSETVSFTGPGGAVVKPVVGGTWQVSNDQKQVSFSLSFPESLQRRDVIIDGGTTLELVGRLYTQTELDELNEAYYQARENMWQVGGELNDLSRQRGAAKKWNEAKGKWEKPDADGNIFSTLQKQVNYWTAKAKQDQMNQRRPDANSISSLGKLPGFEEGVYIAKGGVIRQSKNGPVMGTWQAEPITKNPASYRK
jgi:hypothetical protein